VHQRLEDGFEEQGFFFSFPVLMLYRKT